MLERLKTLPLTILLTILIWMYAEAQVNHSEATADVADVPVSVSGPPGMLAQYHVELSPQRITLTISGDQGQIESLKKRIAEGDKNLGISADLDITSSDSPSASMSQRTLRCVLPAGLSLRGEPQVGFRLLPAAPATRSAGLP